LQSLYTEIFERGGMKMADYLSREEILRVFSNLTVKNPNDKYQHGMQDAIDCLIPEVINGMEAADVQPVKHGKWDFQGYQLFKCTNCKEMFTQDQLEAMQNHKDCEEWTFPNFCPNCGADMRGDTN
jgi:hypothetical protein